MKTGRQAVGKDDKTLIEKAENVHTIRIAKYEFLIELNRVSDLDSRC